MKLLWTTDLHLMNAGEKHRSGVDPELRVRACLDDMLAEHADAARLIITGDLIQLRNTAAYGVLAETLAEVPIPVRLLVGNHDDRDALARAFPALPLSNGFVQTAEHCRVTRKAKNAALNPNGFFTNSGTHILAGAVECENSRRLHHK